MEMMYRENIKRKTLLIGGYFSLLVMARNNSNVHTHTQEKCNKQGQFIGVGTLCPYIFYNNNLVARKFIHQFFFCLPSFFLLLLLIIFFLVITYNNNNNRQKRIHSQYSSIPKPQPLMPSSMFFRPFNLALSMSLAFQLIYFMTFS